MAFKAVSSFSFVTSVSSSILSLNRLYKARAFNFLVFSSATLFSSANLSASSLAFLSDPSLANLSAFSDASSILS